MDVSGRSLLAGPSIGEYDTSKKSVEKVNELELAPMRSPKIDGLDEKADPDKEVSN